MDRTPANNSGRPWPRFARPSATSGSQSTNSRSSRRSESSRSPSADFARPIPPMHSRNAPTQDDAYRLLLEVLDDPRLLCAWIAPGSRGGWTVYWRLAGGMAA